MILLDSTDKPTTIDASICHPVSATNLEGDIRHQQAYNTRD